MISTLGNQTAMSDDRIQNLIREEVASTCSRLKQEVADLQGKIEGERVKQRALVEQTNQLYGKIEGECVKQRALVEQTNQHDQLYGL